MYVYKQRCRAGVHEFLPSDALILHIAFFLPLSLSFFYCYPKVYINLFYCYLISLSLIAYAYITHFSLFHVF